MALRNPQYEAALRGAVIDHGLKGHWIPGKPELITDEALTLIWRDAALRTMASHEKERFATLSLEAQKVYFPEDSIFAPGLFKAEFLALARKQAKAAVH